MVNVKSFNVTTENFVQHDEIFVATVKHDFDSTNLVVSCTNDKGSVIFDFEFPDTNHTHIKVLKAENVKVNILSLQ